MGYAGEAMNELHGTDVFTEDERTTPPPATDWQRELQQRGQDIADAMGRYRGTEPLIDAVRRLASDYHKATTALSNHSVLDEVADELSKARATHAPMNGHHEGYAVMLEEMDELWEVCKRNTHKILPTGQPRNIEEIRAAKRSDMRKEALQIAAMAVRFIDDVCDKQ